MIHCRNFRFCDLSPKSVGFCSNSPFSYQLLTLSSFCRSLTNTWLGCVCFNFALSFRVQALLLKHSPPRILVENQKCSPSLSKLTRPKFLILPPLLWWAAAEVFTQPSWPSNCCFSLCSLQCAPRMGNAWGSPSFGGLDAH